MTQTKIIAELGSCHEGKKEKGFELIDKAVEAGCWAVKFQLFPNTEEFTKTGNIWLDPELYLKFQAYARKNKIYCGASTFDEENLQFLVEEAKPDFYKFSYRNCHQTQTIQYAGNTGKPVFVSCDHMNQHLVPRFALRLYCIPEYPVRYLVDFGVSKKERWGFAASPLFKEFSGFSDHTLGTHQSQKAISYGAQYLEKHMKLSGQNSCPDTFFAIEPIQMKSLVNHAIRVERNVLR